VRKAILSVLLLLVVAFVVLQFVPGPSRDNPPVTAPADFPPEVAAVMKAACMDCHSNETRWPWYSKVAPTSWFVAKDVQQARAVLNFSNWENLPAETRYGFLQEMWNKVVERDMPHKPYALMHPQVELSASDRKTVGNWLNERIVALEREQASAAE
jgi:hypothetical protein